MCKNISFYSIATIYAKSIRVEIMCSTLYARDSCAEICINEDLVWKAKHTNDLSHYGTSAIAMCCTRLGKKKSFLLSKKI